MKNGVINELFSYEESQIKKLEKTRGKLLESVESEKIASGKRIEKKKQVLDAELQKSVENSKEKARADINSLKEEYRKKIDLLDRNSKKNFEKAVERVFTGIIK